MIENIKETKKIGHAKKKKIDQSYFTLVMSFNLFLELFLTAQNIFSHHSFKPKQN